MIRESIEVGTKVWHCEYGTGIFDGWVKDNPKLAIVDFGDGRVVIPSKDLTEVEE